MQGLVIKIKKVIRGTAFFSLACVIHSNAYAQNGADVLNALIACQNMPSMSSRLACYDQILPPAGSETAGNVSATSPVVTPRPSTPAPSPGTGSLREQQLEETVAELEQRLEQEALQDAVTARIIEVQRPTARSSRLIAEDGRVFVESNTTTIVTWPDTPFNVDVNRSLTGTITIRAIDDDQVNRGQGRGRGRGVRVTLE